MWPVNCVRNALHQPCWSFEPLIAPVRCMNMEPWAPSAVIVTLGSVGQQSASSWFCVCRCRPAQYVVASSGRVGWLLPMSEAWCERATDLAEQAIQRRKPGPLRDHVLEACLLCGATLAVCCPRFDSGNAQCANALRRTGVRIHAVLLSDALCSMRLQRLFLSSLQGRGGVSAMIASHPMLIW